MIFRVTHVAPLAFVLVALAGPAFAHTGHGDAGGLVHGFMHPIRGLDHVLAMVGVGVYAVWLGRRALWMVPATFIAVMAFGGLLGTFRIADPFFEIGVAMSVVLLGLAVALRVNMSTITTIAVVGLIAVFHGYAHGAEMPVDVSGYAYAGGFMTATILLHGAGVALGLLMTQLNETVWRRAMQLAGSAMALAGVAMLAAAT